jgi:hypothetical protein
MKLDLPDGTKVGSIVKITWLPADNIEAGTWDGRILKIRPPVILVKVTYGPNDIPSDEQISINLDTGSDLKYQTIVTLIELVHVHLPAKTPLRRPIPPKNLIS